MEQEELKRKLMGLWEKTTHNSKEILSVLFDYYFDVEYIEYKESEGKIISALCGIPYSFGYGDKRLKGLYLISLSAEEGFRKKGILSELLNSFNERVSEEFDFTFLVPHTELLADYFGTQDYYSSFFILEERFTSLHDFRNDYLLSLEDSDDRIKELKKDLIDEIYIAGKDNGSFTDKDIIEYIRNIEKIGTSTVNLCHTEKDLEFILEEDMVKNTDYFVSFDSDNKITGILFIHKEDIKRIRVIASYVSDKCSYYALLDYIKRLYPEYSISINTSDPQYQYNAIIQQNYASSNPEGGDLDNTFNSVDIPFNINKLLLPLGMVRLLRFENILKYIAETRSDVDFKLHIRDYVPPFSHESLKDPDKHTVYIVKNGRFTLSKVSDPQKDASILNLSGKEVSELLLRKNDTSNLIMEAFGIPRLNLQMRLLPC